MAKILYHAVPVPWRREEKYAFLEKAGSIAGVKWRTLKPDDRGNWLRNPTDDEFNAFLPIGSKAAKHGGPAEAVFRTYSNGVKSNNDDFVYDFSADRLAQRARQMVEAYDAELARWRKAGSPEDIEAFLRVDPAVLKWIRRTKKSLARGLEVEFDPGKIRRALYRPFCRKFLYLEHLFIEDTYQIPEYFPELGSRTEVIWLKVGAEVPSFALGTDQIPDLLPQGGSQCFPLFTYSEDGKERRDNVTIKAVTHFRNFYDDAGIQRRDIFHYVYALLHHPAYRARYAENLKRDLPRIPFIDRHGAPHGPLPLDGQDARTDKERKADAKVFHQFAAAGERLLALHVGYEQQPEFPLKRIENKEAKLDWRVEAMKLLKPDASSPSPPSGERAGVRGLSDAHTLSLRYNDFLTLAGIPAEVLDYRLGNRSALEWVIDQYRVTRDADDNLVSDPNRLDDEQYIVRLLGQVVTVSVETLKTIRTLSELKFP